MSSKALIIQLVEYVDQFEKQNDHLDDYTMEGFLSFMQAREFDRKEQVLKSSNRIGPKRPEGVVAGQNFTAILSRMIGLIYRYAREYTKMALEDSELQTMEEFSFLIVLTTYDSLSKTDLIQKNVMPKTSGTEVVKRLLRKKLIHQFDDENDRRSQLVAVTPKGMEELKKVFPKMRMASEVITGNLTLQEQQTLSFLLQKLDAWHNNIYLNHREETLEELVKIK